MISEIDLGVVEAWARVLSDINSLISFGIHTSDSYYHWCMQQWRIRYEKAILRACWDLVLIGIRAEVNMSYSSTTIIDYIVVCDVFECVKRVWPLFTSHTTHFATQILTPINKTTKYCTTINWIAIDGYQKISTALFFFVLCARKGQHLTLHSKNIDDVSWPLLSMCKYLMKEKNKSSE